MIKVRIKNNNNKINNITIKGHAEYDERGKDIVCASVSSIVITTINAIVRIDSSSIKYKDLEGFIEIKILKDNSTVYMLLKNMVNLLLELEKDYKNYIEIREV